MQRYARCRRLAGEPAVRMFGAGGLRPAPIYLDLEVLRVAIHLWIGLAGRSSHSSDPAGAGDRCLANGGTRTAPLNPKISNRSKGKGSISSPVPNQGR